MKKIYLEAVVLALIYLIVSLIIIDMNMSKGGLSFRFYFARENLFGTFQGR